MQAVTNNHYSLVRTEAEAAGRIHPDLSPRTMARWRALGKGPRFVKIGRRVAYRDADLDAWLAEQTIQNTAQGRK